MPMPNESGSPTSSPEKDPPTKARRRASVEKQKQSKSTDDQQQHQPNVPPRRSDSIAVPPPPPPPPSPHSSTKKVNAATKPTKRTRSSSSRRQYSNGTTGGSGSSVRPTSRRSTSGGGSSAKTAVKKGSAARVASPSSHLSSNQSVVSEASSVYSYPSGVNSGGGGASSSVMSSPEKSVSRKKHRNLPSIASDTSYLFQDDEDSISTGMYSTSHRSVGTEFSVNQMLRSSGIIQAVEEEKRSKAAAINGGSGRNLANGGGGKAAIGAGGGTLMDKLGHIDANSRESRLKNSQRSSGTSRTTLTSGSSGSYGSGAFHSSGRPMVPPRTRSSHRTTSEGMESIPQGPLPPKSRLHSPVEYVDGPGGPRSSSRRAGLATDEGHGVLIMESPYEDENEGDGSSVGGPGGMMIIPSLILTSELTAHPEETEAEVRERAMKEAVPAEVVLSSRPCGIKWFWLTIISLLGMIGAGVVLAVVLLNRDTTPAGPSPYATPAPTPSPTLTAMTQERDVTLKRALAAIFVDDEEEDPLLSDSSSPQSLAYDWLLFEDTFDLDAPEVDNRFIQVRYALTVLYYQTDGPNQWRRSCGFLSKGINHCRWNDGVCGVFCSANTNNVAGLDFFNVDLMGAIPTELPLALASTLEYLNLESNQINGTLPTQMGSMSLMTTLDLKGNQLSGSLPSDLFEKMTNLQHLELQENEFVGSFPTSIGMCPLLVRLQLNDNFFTGTFPQVVNEQMPALEVFDIQRNGFTGALPTLGASSLLTHYHVSENSLEDSIVVSFLSSHPALQAIELYNNTIRGQVPPEVSELTSLETFRADHNMLTGFIPSFERCEGLKAVTLSHNEMFGRVSVFFSTTKSELELLDISNNLFAGAIPLTIGNFVGLTDLRMHENRLTGVLPSSLGLLRNLVGELRLHGNSFVGSIPTQLGRLTNLEGLDLGVNRFSGRIPTQMNSMTSLKYLHLETNFLTGSVEILLPSSFADLEELFVEENRLTGSLESFCVAFRRSPRFDAQADCANQEVDCRCCSICYPLEA